jgi:HlyD family secretion protein
MAYFLGKISAKELIKFSSILIAFTLLLVTGFYTISIYLEHQQKTVAFNKTKSLKRLMLKTVDADGYLEPLGKVTLLSAPYGMEAARVQQLRVKDGDRIKAGSIIAILDSNTIMKSNLDNAIDRKKIAFAHLNQVTAGAKTADIEAQRSRISELHAELYGQISTQRANIANLKAQLEGEERAQQATVERLKADFINKDHECDRYTSLLEAGAVSISLKEAKCLEKYTAQKSYDEARVSLSRIIFTLQSQINAAQENLKRTINTLNTQVKTNKKILDSTAEVRPTDVAVAEAELDAASSAVEQAKANYELTLVRSPMDAQILEIHAKPNEIARNGIVEIGKTQSMVAVAEVYETDIRHVKIGQKAIIKSLAFDNPLYGHVVEIGANVARKNTLNDDPVSAADARIVEVRIKLDNLAINMNSALTNLKVEVEIII